MATQDALMTQAPLPATELSKRPRLGETIIQTLLFLSGAISILTTVGIVYILGTESLNFFTRQLWENTNKRTVIELTAEATTFETNSSGAALETGDTIRLNEEVMQIVAIEGTIITVERGLQESLIEAHSAGVEIFRSNRVNPIEIITTSSWSPQLGQFGIWPLVIATMMTSIIAMLVALPVGLATAVYLSEYASVRVRSILKPILEILNGVPTVVYGYFALTFMTPFLRSFLGDNNVQIFNTASAGIVVGILIIPIVTSLSEDALHAVPDSLRQAAYGLGATKLETSLRIVLPAALSGITAAFVVAISRAVGETMIVAIAAGAGPKNFVLSEDGLGFVFNPLIAAETMTGHIVRISGGDLSYDSIDYNSIFAIGLMLFIMTLTLNIFSRRITDRFREVYE